MGKPTAAPAHFPYLNHRTFEEVLRDNFDLAQSIVDLDSLSRQRALSTYESNRLELLLRKQSRIAGQ